MPELTVQIKDNAFSCTVTNALAPLRHLHKELEIIYIYSGSATAYIDNRAIPMAQGDLLLVCPNQIHYYLDVVQGRYQIMIFSSDILFELQSLFRSYSPKETVFHLTPDSFAVKLLEELAIDDRPYQQTRRLGLVNGLMAELLTNTQLVPLPAFNDKTIKDILCYCDDHYLTDITLQEMADTLHLNKTHISRVFNQKIGQNFKSYVNALRITKACDLLRDTDDAISDISEQVGFGSFRSFNRAFLSMMNITPSEYRKSLKVGI